MQSFEVTPNSWTFQLLGVFLCLNIKEPLKSQKIERAEQSTLGNRLPLDSGLNINFN